MCNRLKNKNKKYTLKGSYTVEASFLLPIILSVIVILIYLSFFLHDRAVLSASAYQAAMRGGQLINGENVMQVVTESAESLIRNRLLGTSEVETNVECAGGKVKVSYSGKMNIPGGALLCKYMTGGKMFIDMKAEAEAETTDVVKFVRRIRSVTAIGKGN